MAGVTKRWPVRANRLAVARYLSTQGKVHTLSVMRSGGGQFVDCDLDRDSQQAETGAQRTGALTDIDRTLRTFTTAASTDGVATDSYARANLAVSNRARMRRRTDFRGQPRLH